MSATFLVLLAVLEAGASLAFVIEGRGVPAIMFAAYAVAQLAMVWL